MATPHPALLLHSEQTTEFMVVILVLHPSAGQILAVFLGSVRWNAFFMYLFSYTGIQVNS